MTVMLVAAFQMTAGNETACQDTMGDVKWMAHEAIGYRHSGQAAPVAFLSALLLCLCGFQI
jgi:hypothetical protein